MTAEIHFSFQLEELPVGRSNVEDLVAEQSVVINELRTVAEQCKELIAKQQCDIDEVKKQVGCGV